MKDTQPISRPDMVYGRRGSTPAFSPPPALLLERRGSSINVGRRGSSGSQPDTPSAVIALWNEFKDLFNKKTIRIDSDSVGYGFVLRGEGPSYVQTVDPSGPAAQAGLRVGQIVQMVNGIDVMNMSHKETAKAILARQLAMVTLTVLEPADNKVD